MTAQLDDQGDDLDLREPGRGRGVLAATFVLLVLAGLYLAAAFYVGDKVPAQTTVGGVPVGGMTEPEARQALERGLAEEVKTPVSVSADGKTFELVPSEAGLSVDHAESLSGLTGFSLNPVDLLNHVRGGVERPVVAAVDEDALAAAVDAGAKGVERKPVEGSVSIDGDQVKTKPSKPGLAVDRGDLVSQVEDRWPRSTTFTARTSDVGPVLAQAEIDRFVKDDLKPLAGGPVTVTTTDPLAETEAAKKVSFPVPAKELLKAVTIKADKGKLSATVDDAKLVAAVSATGNASGMLRAAQDAKVVAKSSTSFSVTPSKDGLALKEDTVAAPVKEAMTKSGDQRTAAVESTAKKPELTTEKAQATLPKEEISTFTSALPANPTRTHNIKTAARALDGTYVAPGETFSLNGVLGQRTAAKGYNKAGVIINGRLREDYGGGISQLSTTLFNAVFFSGVKIEEYHPHSFYISRYPEGREATISWPDVDNRWTNDTKGGILVKASATDSEVTVTFYGTKTWDIKAVKGPRRNVVQPKTIRDDKEGCVPQSPNVGFDVTVERIFLRGGNEVKRSSFTTHYIPSDSVTCTKG